MKKVTMEIVETLKFRREITLEIPDEMTEEELEKLCVKMERNDHISDAIHDLKEAGAQVNDYDTDYDSPEFGDVEVAEFHIEGT